ncbi:ABC transporter substrate-binding protein [Streptomyces specialis]|uniref:ABC transporter substrate-binding protein n=1 Tax=Streptomyces specialis TaxID=498367 RepID=UPI00073E1BE4|nr:ABC transporter substrate-binding protein [Streptomyces specialis]
MNSPFPARLSRRALLSTGGALSAGALLTACGDNSPTGSAGDGTDANAPSGAFRFTDDRGETVELDAVPERIVAYVGTAAALHDYGIRSVGVFGPTTNPDGTPGPQAGRLDLDDIRVLGTAWGEFDIEDYTVLEPQLLVTNMFEPGALWYVPDESADTIAGLAPTLGILVAPTADRPGIRLGDVIDRYTQLATALGADLTTTAVTEAKARFEAAAEAVRRAARDNPGIKVLACSGAADLFYVSDSSSAADLAWFQELGVELIVPEHVDAGGFFESLSWENADAYPADLLLMDSRGVALQPDDLADKPTFTRLPAVEAGQITGWNSEPVPSHAGCAPLLENLAEALRTARKVS